MQGLHPLERKPGCTNLSALAKKEAPVADCGDSSEMNSKKEQSKIGDYESSGNVSLMLLFKFVMRLEN